MHSVMHGHHPVVFSFLEMFCVSAYSYVLPSLQLDQGPNNVPKETLYHDHFFAIFCIFSGIFLVNYVLMNSAANVFYSTGLLLLTFQDALSLLDQVDSLISSVSFINNTHYACQYWDYI